MQALFHQYYQSPIGWMRVRGTDEAILEILFWEDRSGEERPNKLTRQAVGQLQAYFERKLRVFDLPLQPQGTSFQKQVWDQLLQIGYGTTISYMALARRMGDIKTIRAVARANACNPLAIVIPCHRVIGEDGSLVGYAAGLWRKQWLLEHESSMHQLSLHFG
ncbi:MAG: methylated-DNA--[protein]-cysteine S-methyltransferase [Thermoflavifilum sp.]|nr:methylated-DNA--[protein]-cysteine S-methyltransferase [Thermoflavifilum sp.]